MYVICTEITMAITIEELVSPDGISPAMFKSSRAIPARPTSPLGR